MTFVDANVFMYAMGRPHPLQREAWNFFEDSQANAVPLCTSAEVLQELAHAYLRVGRRLSFDAAMALVRRLGIEVWPLEEADVMLARRLHERQPNLSARDLCHLAICIRRRASAMMTFDRELAAAFNDWPDTSREPSV